MGLLHWLQQEWFTALQSVGIIAGLWFTADSFRKDTRSRLLHSLFALSEHHREIWSNLYSRPELKRVLRQRINLRRKPVTDEEAIFVTLLLLHLSTAFHAKEMGLFIPPEGLERDIRWFLSLPIPHSVWEKSRAFQDAGFVSFIEVTLADEEKS